MRVYIYLSVDEVDEVLKVELNQVVEDQDALGEAIHPRKNLKDTHMKIWENVKS